MAEIISASMLRKLIRAHDANNELLFDECVEKIANAYRMAGDVQTAESIERRADVVAICDTSDPFVYR